MYSSILSNIALSGSKTQFYFPFFCHSLRLLHLAWFVFKHKLLFWSPPTQEEVGHIFVRILSATMLVLAYHSPLPFLCECMISYEPIGWLCWGLTSQSTIFQSCRDGAIASWVINQYFRGVKCLAQGHNTAAVGLEPRTSRSGVRHSTTEPPRSHEPIGGCCFGISLG